MEELCGFGSRRSGKRRFVFVSKVLGKHYPVRPRRMGEVYASLAARLQPVSGPTVVVALAETATGLGQGIYECLLHTTLHPDLLFIHSTRYCLSHPVALRFEEGHSHAPDHFVYEPLFPADARLFATASTLILVDDEVSTGNTLVNLAQAYRRMNPRVARVQIVTLTDWLDASGRSAVIDRIGVPTSFHSLLRGSFVFHENDDFQPEAASSAIGRGDIKDHCLSSNFGRLGIRGSVDFVFDDMLRGVKLCAGQKLLVLGTGEFLHSPYRLARFLEERGFDVHFQSTTRSPLLSGEAIASSIEFTDNYFDEIPNYAYNVGGRHYDRVLVGYETNPLPKSHQLPRLLDAHPVFF